MDYINHTNGQDEESNQQTTFTRAEVEEIIRELEERREHQRQLQTIGSELPLAISQALDGTSTTQLKDNFKQYKRSVQRYNHDEWTTAEQINKEFIPELKNWKVDAYQLVHTIYKITETTRIQARASTELYEQLSYLQDKTEFASTKDRDIFNNTIEQAQRLAVYGFGSAKFQENDAKEVAIKALKLPTSIKHLEHSTEEDGKKNSFDGDFVERLQRARFEDKEEADHEVDLGVGIGHAVNLFRQEEEAEVLLSPNNETTPLNSQQIQHPTTANNSTTSLFTSNLYQTTTTNTTSSTISQQEFHIQSTLRGTPGWDPTRGSPDSLLQLLDTNNDSPMASINCEGGIQDSICLPSNTMETQIIKYKPSRSASSERSSQQIPFSRNNRNHANTIRKIPIKIFHDSRKYQETTYSGLSKVEPTHPMRTLQDGGCTGAKRINRKGRFHVQDRLEGRLHCGPNSSRIASIPHFQKRRKNLSISFPRIWTKRRSQAILKTNEICNRTVTLPRNPLSILSRRHLSTVKVKRRSIKNNTNGNKTFKIFGIHNQRRKEHTYTLSNTGIPRIPIQHKEDEDYSTSTQDQQPSTKDQTSVTANQEILQVDCSSTGESYINDPSDRRSTPSYSTSSTRSSKEPTTEQSELGKTVPDISTKSARVSMVEEINNNEERPTDSVHGSTNTTDHNLHGQLRLRLGSEFANDQDLWLLEQGGTRNVNKRPRTESSILCVEDACKKIRKLHNKSFHRQHDGIEIHNKIWRNSFTPVTRISSDDSGHLQQIQFEGNLSTYTGDKEHQCRPTIKTTAATLRTDNSKKDVSTDFTTMGTTTDRRLCCDTQPSTEEILESSSGSNGRSPGRFPTAVAEEGNVLEPSLETDSESYTTNQITEDPSDSSSDSILAQSILVSNDFEDETSKQSDYYEDQQEVFPSRLEIINEKRRKSGLINEASIKYIAKSTRKSTEKAYDNGWKHWQQWCFQQDPQIDPTAYNSTNVLHFLVDNNKFSSNHLNTLRSSIASVFRVLHPEEIPLANQSIIQAFFAAKRRSEIRIPSTPQLETWDIDKMTDFLVSTWANSSSLTLYDLQLKTVALLCLATMARPRSDIGRLQFQDIIFNFEDSNNSIPTGVKIHFREPKENQVKTTRLGLLQDTRICPVSTLYLFISKSNHLRVNLPTDHTLFLAHIEKPEQVASIRPSTMSSWVKSIMERSAIDTTIYKAHSIRSASSTKAVEKGHSIQAVKEHAGWSLNSNTFERFYYKPTNQDFSSRKKFLERIS
ncbi:hypothetical protein G6F43_011463 [Rhizopus delemar]|nr:hypothetical protein G6F43_011463 [Rhizopus delemar]